MSGIHVIGGGTVSHVRSHLALCAPAYGGTARAVAGRFAAAGLPPELHLTRMADPASRLETNADVAALVARLVADPATRLIVMNAALCDFDGSIGGVPSGRHARRLKTREGAKAIDIVPADKVIGRIRAARPDVVVVGFKTTTEATADEQHAAALNQIAESGVDLVFANDTVTRRNLVVAADGRRLADSFDRDAVLDALVGAAAARLGARPPAQAVA